MKPLTLIYWIRMGLGLVIGILCGVYVYTSVARELADIYTLLTGLSFAMLFYIVSYYVLKLKFLSRVEKQSKLMTQGIGIYFFAWIVSWTLFVTMLMPSVSVSIYLNESGELAEGETFWVAAMTDGGSVVQNVTTDTGTVRLSLLPPGGYTFTVTSDNYSAENRVLTIGWALSFDVRFNVTRVSE